MHLEALVWDLSRRWAPKDDKLGALGICSKDIQCVTTLDINCKASMGNFRSQVVSEKRYSWKKV